MNCQICKIKVARKQPYCGVLFLCESCASLQAVEPSDDSPQREMPPPKCQTIGCENVPHDHKAWDSGEYCKQCFRQIEEGADARRCDAQANRIAGFNDDGTLTRLPEFGGTDNDGHNRYDIDYGRKGG